MDTGLNHVQHTLKTILYAEDLPQHIHLPKWSLAAEEGRRELVFISWVLDLVADMTIRFADLLQGQPVNECR